MAGCGPTLQRISSTGIHSFARFEAHFYKAWPEMEEGLLTLRLVTKREEEEDEEEGGKRENKEMYQVTYVVVSRW